ncbi:hypothetical protein PHLCEN_2v3479 [Hermanssonia centrifuga]|uniref:Uncharacterized protein n=1 Tax=Hermanssonia centrifuga TaxID=98765 RepID=A0A2R6QIR7_9APHY|nr:hypothetical protein PHLCEN_2v3479 [Hermanssonia centrifuga]
MFVRREGRRHAFGGEMHSPGEAIAYPAGYEGKTAARAESEGSEGTHHNPAPLFIFLNSGFESLAWLMMMMEYK